MIINNIYNDYKVNRLIELLNNNCRQHAVIYYSKDNGTMGTIEEQYIVQNGLVVDRGCVSGNTIELGSAVSSEVTLTLKNNMPELASENFLGKNITVALKIDTMSSDPYDMLLGIFTIDEIIENQTTTTFKALDYLCRFDKPVPNTLSFPCTLSDMLSLICNYCNMQIPLIYTLPSEVGFNVGNYLIQNPFNTEDITCRQLLMWIAEIYGTCATIWSNITFSLCWYTKTGTSLVLRPQHRYNSHLSKYETAITGIAFNHQRTTGYLIGTDDKPLNMPRNEVLQTNAQTIMDKFTAEGRFSNFLYYPFEAITKPMPYVHPLDLCTFMLDDTSPSDPDDPNYSQDMRRTSIITNVTYTLNGATKLVAKGDNRRERNYSDIYPFTSREASIIRKLQD